MNNDQFVGRIDKEGNILTRDYTTNKDIIIGVDNQRHDEILKDRDNVLAKAEKYLNELYDAGIRHRPKTQEQIASEQADFNNGLVAMLKEMREEIKVLKGANHAKPTVEIVG